MDQAVCQFGLANVRGGTFTNVRGVHPASFILSIEPRPAFSGYVGNLTLTFGSTTLSFPNCAMAPHSMAVWKDRIPYIWNMIVLDRRWNWQYVRISGEYNRRRADGKLDDDTKLSLTKLIEKLLTELGESFQLTGIPDVYPYVNWQNAYASRELEWLCELAGLAICPEMTQARTLVEPIGTGVSLPVPAPSFNVSPVFRYQQAVAPQSVEVRCAPTIVQKKLDLVPVALDEDGTIQPLDDVSYKPADGWESQWYTTFQGVDEDLRHLAFATVWRWYRFDVEDLETYQILAQLAESVEDSEGIERRMDCVVEGEFWPQSDLRINVTEKKFPGKFRIRPDLHLVEFAYPVVKWSDQDEVEAADLAIYVAYTRTDDERSLERKTYSKNVTLSAATTKPRVEKRSHLQLVQVDEAVFASPGTNETDVATEANAYLDAIVKNYGENPNPLNEIDMIYGGFVRIELGGQIAQVMYRWGNDRPPTTRASQNHEFDTSTLSHQERRRRSRLSQVADRVLE